MVNETNKNWLLYMFDKLLEYSETHSVFAFV